MRFWLHVRTSTPIAAIFVAGLVANPAAAGDFGLGVILGEPTGVSIKNWTSDRTAIDAAAAWSFTENASFQLHADYLMHGSKWIKDESASVKVPYYFGIGARIKVKDDNGRGRNSSDTLLGVRIPLGVTYLPKSGRFDLFLEVVPILDLVPATEFAVNAAIGARFYF